MPLPRKKENKGLPARWRLLHGAYHFRVPQGFESEWEGKQQLFRLGKTLPEAYRTWADRIASIDDAKTIADLLDRYALQVVPTKSVTTQAQNAIAIKRLRAMLGAVPLLGLKPRHVDQYIDKRSAKIAARREIEILSHAYTKAVEWGISTATRSRAKFASMARSRAPDTSRIGRLSNACRSNRAARPGACWRFRLTCE